MDRLTRFLSPRLLMPLLGAILACLPWLAFRLAAPQTRASTPAPRGPGAARRGRPGRRAPLIPPRRGTVPFSWNENWDSPQLAASRMPFGDNFARRGQAAETPASRAATLPCWPRRFPVCRPTPRDRNCWPRRGRRQRSAGRDRRRRPATPPTAPPGFPRPLPQPAGSLLLPPEAAAPRSEQLEKTAAQTDQQVRHGFELANRGAYYAARAEFIAGLRLLAQALDAERHTTNHSRAPVPD